MFLIPIMLAVLTTTADVNALSRDAFEDNRELALTGTVTAVLHGSHFVLRDASGSTHVRNISGVQPAPGDRVVLRGHTAMDAFRQEQTMAESLAVVGGGSVPAPVVETVAHVAGGRCDYANVIVNGFVTDIVPDDIDAQWSYLVLEAGGAYVYVTVPKSPNDRADGDRLIRRKVRVTGTVIPNHCGARRFIGPHVQVAGAASVEPLPTDAPRPLPDALVNHLPPADVIHRTRNVLEGAVRCAWGGRSLLIEGRDGEVHRIDLSKPLTNAPVGAVVRACGLPETDLYRLNLSHADCTILDASGPDAPLPPQEIRTLEHPSTVHWDFHGRLVRLEGRVLAEATPSSSGRAILGVNGRRVSVDVSSVPELAERMAVGSVVRVSGCGLVDIDNWRPGVTPPAQKEFVVVLRNRDDLVIVSTPPWWTPARLMIVICALFAGLVAIVIWNRLLNRLVESRSRQLLHEELAHATAELKTQERTRLAVELHDALSQTLTGVAWQIDAADSARQKDLNRIEHHLDLARRTIDSCRNELRNCLWDLRSLALEDADAESAIRRTLAPHAADAEVTVAFPVSRRVFSDSTFHDVLCILREFVTNAVRHGKARRIAVDGRLTDGRLVVSVTDDGGGFDPANRPGSAEGHFGLLGVAERIRKLGGTLDVNSAPGRGATFTFTLSKRHET